MNRPIATFDITNRCELRCRHCYFFPSNAAQRDDLGEAEFLTRLEERCTTYGIRSAFWIGGEPLLRPRLLERAMALVPRNAVSTSGMVPIPTTLGAALLVSLDGPRELHDTLRGTGAFDTVLGNIAPLPAQSFALSTTLTTETLEAIEHIPQLVEQTRAMGALVGFHVGPTGDPLLITGDARDHAIDRLQALHLSGAILNSPEALDEFRPGRAAEMRRGCIYRDRAIAFDPWLEPKRPCTFAARANCNACGCSVVAAHASRANGDAASDGLLRALFPMMEKADQGSIPGVTVNPK